MGIDRRSLMAVGTGLGVAAAAAVTPSHAGPRKRSSFGNYGNVAELVPDSEKDQTGILQRAIDVSSPTGTPVVLPAGRFVIGNLQLRPGTRLIGAYGGSTLAYAGGAEFVTAKGANDIVIAGVAIDGWKSARDLISLTACGNVMIDNVVAKDALGTAIQLEQVSGTVTDCTISQANSAAIFSNNAIDLEISHNLITDCANNGILVWRSEIGDDGTILTANKIARIKAKDGGSGQNGNGINIFRANGVTATSNRITDCAYSAIRANASSNVMMIANNCAAIGEVALYAEFGFEGAIISNNLIDTAATGIAVTNFNEGGRLSVVQGNLVRNLFRREYEPQDKRGIGIGVEADTAVIGNVIEKAATAGLAIGWESYMRDVSANANIICDSKLGILITSHKDAGACLVTNNLITGATEGAIRAAKQDHPRGPDMVNADTRADRIAIWDNKGR